MAVFRLGLLGLTATYVLAAQERLRWEAVGQIGGATQAVAVQGRYAYVGVGLRMVILDVSDPAEPREVGVTRPFPDQVEDIAVQDRLAYVAAGAGGLRVVDVSDAALPVEIGAWESPGHAEGVALAGNIVYLAGGSYGLRVIDVSNPAKPVEIGSAYPMNYAFKVAVDGGFAYIAAAGAGLLIADVTDPKRPLEVGSLATVGFAYGVAVTGDTAWVADAWEGLRVVDVADRVHPSQTAAYKAPGWAMGVSISGATAYVADASGGLRVLDVSDRASPTEIQRLEMPGGHAGRVTVDGLTAYVADRNLGLRVVSLAADSGPVQIGSYQPLSYADSVAVSGNYAYVAAGVAGFAVVDISDRARPRQVASLRILGSARDIAVRGNYAYVCTMGPGQALLYVFDITDPVHPGRNGLYRVNPGQSWSLDVVDRVAYIAAEGGLQIVNVADPQSPVRLAYLQISPGVAQEPTALGVASDGKLAYVAASAGGLIIVDVSDPGQPVRLGAVNTGMGQARHVALAGNRVYVADYGFGLHAVDVSDPARPVVVGSLRMGLAEGVTRVGDLVYVASGDQSLQVVDVADPSRPVLAGSVLTQGYARRVAVQSGAAYLADGPNGLVIVEPAGGSSGNGAAARFAGTGPMIAPPAAAQAPRRELRMEVTRAGHAPAAAASACVVTSLADSGAGTLRECIEKGQGGLTITFDPAAFPPSAPAAIRLSTSLPALLVGNTTIDGSDAGVILDGSGCPAGNGAITLRSDGNSIKGLQFLGFPANVITIQGDYNAIGGDRSRGRGPVGEGNLISGNGASAIKIDSSNNVVIGNLVGTDLSGAKALGNNYVAVFITGGANNRIGGTDPRDRNIVSGTTGSGITINHGTGNLVIGNYVGTDITGTVGLGNTVYGISMEGGSFNNVVQGNVASGNKLTGILIGDPGSSYNAIIGNSIGTNATGAKAIPNGQGVNVGAPFNRIGGMRPEERNLISGNRGDSFINGFGNLVLGNYIGTDLTGRQAIPNRGALYVGAHTFVEGNLIGGNGSDGASATNYTYFGGNLIGVDASGQTAIPNDGFGVRTGGHHNIFQANVIANNRGGGISVDPLSLNTIRQNSIYANAAKGIQCSGGCVGGLAAPVLTAVGVMTVSGTACPDCEVEVFSDAGRQGRIFEGSIQTDASGIFRFEKHSPLNGPNVTATTTDRRGNTSEFSAERTVPKP